MVIEQTVKLKKLHAKMNNLFEVKQSVIQVFRKKLIFKLFLFLEFIRNHRLL